MNDERDSCHGEDTKNFLMSISLLEAVSCIYITSGVLRFDKMDTRVSRSGEEGILKVAVSIGLYIY
jgi:hypothetical protein